MQLDAYTLRKMAPRLLIAVVAVNLSIYLCLAAVDLTNIVGKGLGQLLVTPFSDATVFDIQIKDNFSNGIIGGAGALAGAGILGIILTAIFAGGFAGFLATAAVGAAGTILLALLPFLFLAVVGIGFVALAVLLTVIIRQGLIVFLVIISPLAIALFVLPGTEKYFRQWWSIFLKTLMVYPIIAAIFAMSDILGALIMAGATKDSVTGVAGLAMVMTGIIVVYAPLFLIPFAFKFAGGVLGAMHDIAQGQSGKASGGLRQKIRQTAQDENSWLGKYGANSREQRRKLGLSAGQVFSGIGGAVTGRKNKGEMDGQEFEKGIGSVIDRSYPDLATKQLIPSFEDQNGDAVDKEGYRLDTGGHRIPIGGTGQRRSLRRAMATGYSASSRGIADQKRMARADDLMQNNEAVKHASLDDDLAAALRGTNEQQVRTILYNRNKRGADLENSVAAVMRAKGYGSQDVMNQVAQVAESRATTGWLKKRNLQTGAVIYHARTGGETEDVTKAVIDSNTGQAKFVNASLGEMMEGAVMASGGSSASGGNSVVRDILVAKSREAAASHGTRADLSAPGFTFAAGMAKQIADGTLTAAEGTRQGVRKTIRDSASAGQLANMKAETANMIGEEYAAWISEVAGTGDDDELARTLAKYQGVVDAIGQGKPEVAQAISKLVGTQTVDMSGFKPKIRVPTGKMTRSGKEIPDGKGGYTPEMVPEMVEIIDTKAASYTIREANLWAQQNKGDIYTTMRREYSSGTQAELAHLGAPPPPGGPPPGGPKPP